ncbi:MAG: lipopolysaccharide assembly protein LapB [Ideonella sp.]|jgi:lipopolysaccharide biosynthesis regulator YciM|nr:lipopolysaccharide assembly protein LapB [Ideonella sp.]
MESDSLALWLLLAVPVAFAFGWLGSRLDLRQGRRDLRDTPRAYFKGLNLLLNEQHDKAIDVFIEAVQQDPDTSDLHFALGNLFRRRGEYERAVRVHQHLLARADLPRAERERAQHALAEDFMKAGLFDRAEEAYRALSGTPFETEARLALLALYERSRQWHEAVETARRLEQSAFGSFASRIAHYWCELALEADARAQPSEAEAALEQARRAAPQAARPLAQAGERAAARGDHRAALAAWTELLALDPGAFSLVANAFVDSALATGERAAAQQQLAEASRRAPSLALVDALGRLDTDPTATRLRLLEHLRRQPGLSVAIAVLQSRRDPSPDADERAALEALHRAAAPMRRFRCAACGFEANQHFWQCPACLGWDTFPTRRLEET